jgi:hypothetical protein
MQGVWVNVTRHNPAIQEGDWIAYYNGESKKGDTLWPGRAKVIIPGLEPEALVVADWYGIDENRGTITLEPSQNGEESWHLDRKYCYKVLQGSNPHCKITVNANPLQNTYLVIGRDEEGQKIKMTPEDILIDEEDMRPAKKYGLEFIKCNQNSSLYKAQMFWSCVNKIKLISGLRTLESTYEK